jgi:hypothetical protein
VKTVYVNNAGKKISKKENIRDYNSYLNAISVFTAYNAYIEYKAYLEKVITDAEKIKKM